MGDAGAILVIEDDAGIREALSDFLRSEGFSVDLALDGVEGLERIAARRPDVVLVDLFMPGMNGRQFLAHLRAEAATRTLPVVLMTGSSPAGETAAAADAVLQKPFELDDLLSVVRRLSPQGTMGPPP